MNTVANPQAGVSILEVLVGAAIMTAIGAACLGAQFGATSLMNEAAVRSVLEERAFFAAKEVAFETRWADGTALLLSTSNGSSRADLVTPVGYDDATDTPLWSTTITYQVVPSANDANNNGVVDEGCLVRVQDGDTRVICDDLANGGFSATRTGNEVAFQVRILKLYRGRTITVDAATSVTIRN